MKIPFQNPLPHFVGDIKDLTLLALGQGQLLNLPLAFPNRLVYNVIIMTSPSATPPEVRSNALAELSPGHTRFVQEYYRDRNSAQAYIRAGYSPKQAATNGWHLLQKLRSHVQAYSEEVSEVVGVENARIFAEVALMALYNPGEIWRSDTEEGFLEIKSIEELGEMARLIKSVERTYNKKTGEEKLKVKLYSKHDALELLAKMNGMLKEGGGTLPTVSLNFFSNTPPKDVTHG